VSTWHVLRVYRSKARFTAGLYLFLGVLTLSQSNPFATQGVWGWGGAGAAIGLVLIGLGVDVWRSALAVCEEGLELRRGFRTRRVPWSEVSGFETISLSSLGPAASCVGVRLIDGRRLKARGTVRIDEAGVPALIEELTQAQEQWSHAS